MHQVGIELARYVIILLNDLISLFKDKKSLFVIKKAYLKQEMLVWPLHWLFWQMKNVRHSSWTLSYVCDI